MPTDQVTNRENAAPGRVQRSLDGVEGTFSVLEKWAAALAMAVILVSILITVVARFLNLSMPSYGELAIVSMAPLTFIGGAYCSYLHQHISIDVVEALGSLALRRWVRLGASVAMCVFACIYTWLAFSLLEYSWSVGERLIDLGVPVWIPMACIVLGSCLMCLHAALDIVRVLFNLPRSGKPI